VHPDELRIDGALVRRLIATQFPEWAELRLEPVDRAGTDNVMYRLGDDLVARLPRTPRSADGVVKEQRWLPSLRPHLPLAVPVPVGQGTPDYGYPCRWSIYRWLDGDNAAATEFDDPGGAATALAGFITALGRIDPVGGPGYGEHNSYRGCPLALRDSATRAAIAEQADLIDTAAVSAAWQHALAAPHWTGPSVWVHGDLLALNLLVADGRLSAVIDFGTLGVGDPAVDVMAAWTVLPATARPAFRAALPIDDATWDRARGWALSVALIAIPYYRQTNPVLAALGQRTVQAVLTDPDV
jgi:aminoglycoside phosphotransferase (APT) family kinase protein